MTNLVDQKSQLSASPASARARRQRSLADAGEGEVLGLLGESGSGKSVTLRR
jgi:ABC-type dipeptide/oligopeptide/nickel transport system, ATPase component